MSEFERDPHWSKDTCNKVSKITGLTESQVYKWGWDQKNKIEKDPQASIQKQSVDISYLKSETKNEMMSDKLNEADCSHFKTNEAKTDILTPIAKNDESYQCPKVAQFSPKTSDSK